MMRNLYLSGCQLLAALILLAQGAYGSDTTLDLARIRPDLGNGIQNAGWAYDRYTGKMPTLDAHTEITIADVKGPAVIRQIHILRHFPSELLSRGIVLKIFFDDAKDPAVLVPLEDFFANGCNGKSRHFSSLLMEYAPQTHNCWIPMPFKKRAVLKLENETDVNAASYSFVEWERLPKWEPELGYFHATFKRQVFPLRRDTVVDVFHVNGKGQFIGKQISVVSDEPMFTTGGVFWGEGNHEMDIDCVKSAVEYLGFEDTYNLSWGWQGLFNGLHNATTCCQQEGDPHPVKFISCFRFHDLKPIRFNKSLHWRMNWSYDSKGFGEKAYQAMEKGGFWLDMSHVIYWYQDSPSGYRHELPPLSIRTADLLHSSLPELDGKPRQVTKPSAGLKLMVPGGQDYDSWLKKQDGATGK